MRAIAFRNPHSAIRIPFARRSQSGVALVVTLILLSIITFMAISFMVLSWSQFGAVNTEKDQTQARLAADAAAQRALAQMLAPMMANNNGFNYGITVSTNFINPLGFLNNALIYANPTNVSYNYPNGAPLNAADNLRNIANLWLDPRPPVFITNRFTGGLEFRFFVNLNRNADINGNPLFDPTGLLTVTNPPAGSPPGTPGQPVVAPGGIWVSNFFVGDPQWIGVLQFPDRPHAPDNRFLARLAYFVVPASKTLDLNYMYNYSKNLDRQMPYSTDSFLRNQGAGSGELNLAAFLVDLNTNLWPALRGALPDTYPPYPGYSSPTGSNYCYLWHPPREYATQANRGEAFEDARCLLRYRYLGQQPNAIVQNNVFSVSTLFGASGVSAFSTDFIDGYSAGPVMLASWPPTVDPDVSPALRTGTPWWGANNTNHFFTPQELFDKSKVAIGLPAGRNVPDRLVAAGSDTNSSYNRYTFYRMAAQLGGESAVESDKLNLNYCNVDNQGNIVPDIATNFIPWMPEQFFTNAADRLLKSAGFVRNFVCTTNIQVWPTNLYSTSVHRLLQLAANIYDASTNRFGVNNFPTVFRPLFRRWPDGSVRIAGYREVKNAELAYANTAPPMADLDTGESASAILPLGTAFRPTEAAEALVAGMPLVVGAKKGFPNFNEFAMQTEVQVTRKLQFTKHHPTDILPYDTNLMYLVMISNVFNAEGWNSYTNPYPRDLQMIAVADMTESLTNEFGFAVPINGASSPSNRVVVGVSLPIVAGTWNGFNPNRARYSFRIPFDTSTNAFLFQTNSSYSKIRNSFIIPKQTSCEPVPPYLTFWHFNLRTRLRFILVDTTGAGRIVDYVNLATTHDPVDITTNLAQGGVTGATYQMDGSYGSMWITNQLGYVTSGMENQITAGLWVNTNNLVWNSANDNVAPEHRREWAIDFFRANLLRLPPLFNSTNLYLTTNFACPYQPERSIFVHTKWQVNDPLVHYTIGDLTSLTPPDTQDVEVGNPTTATYSSLERIGGEQPVGRVFLNPPDPNASFFGPRNNAVNRCYEPWGYDILNPTPTKYQLALKDPLVTQSADWAFLTNKFPNPGWLGRVHRGTPWQTVYLKAAPIDLRTWQTWSGNGQYVLNRGQLDTSVVGTNPVVADAVLTNPTNDWRLLDVFTTSFSANAARGKLDINQPNLAAWSAALCGVVVLTNNVPDAVFRGYPFALPQYGALAIDPAGAYDVFDQTRASWSGVAKIVNGINRTRALFPQGVFQYLGDILAVPELTVGLVGTNVVASPFLNLGSLRDNPSYTFQETSGLNDAAYERIPQQVLGLLKCDHTPRFVIYSFGQALKPAEHSVVTGGGQYFQLCTNYQITAEVATRTVVRIDGFDVPPFKPHAVIENFNVLSSEY